MSGQSVARRRLMRDFKKLQEDPPTGCSGAPQSNNLFSWDCILFGPQSTPFEDGTFRLKMDFNEEYPNKPPKVKFTSKVFHPNVYADGSICLDILTNRWSPSYDVSSVLTSIQSLLDMPNPNSPANGLAAQLYQTDRREYEKRVATCVEASWQDVEGLKNDADANCKKADAESSDDDAWEYPVAGRVTASAPSTSASQNERSLERRNRNASTENAEARRDSDEEVYLRMRI